MINKFFKRKNPRLQYYDYTIKGYYFITMCTKDKKHYFGEISKEKIHLNEIGNLAYRNIEKLEKIYKTIKIDKFIVMPNYIHMILVIVNETDLSVQRIIKQYKENNRQIYLAKIIL